MKLVKIEYPIHEDFRWYSDLFPKNWPSPWPKPNSILENMDFLADKFISDLIYKTKPI